MSMLVPNVCEFIAEDHLYRKIIKVIDFKELTRPLKALYSSSGRGGYPIEQGFKCLFLQFLEDKSDRQMEKFVRYDLSAKYFCSFELNESTPDHCYFGRLRERIGTEGLAGLFERVATSLKKAGLIREVFTFVDASELVARVDVWEARDRALEDKKNSETDDQGNPTMNNKNVGCYSSDKEARFGCKGKSRIWFGYKRHVAVDMSHGLISRTEVTPANTTDQQGLPAVCPKTGMVFCDRAYSDTTTRNRIEDQGCHSGVILKNNMQEKDRDKDRWLSSVRMPYEGVFANLEKRARYRGVSKNLFQCLMQALVFNLKRLVTIAAPPIFLVST